MTNYIIYIQLNDKPADVQTGYTIDATDDLDALKQFCIIDKYRRNAEAMMLTMGLSKYRIGKAVIGYHNKIGFVYALENN